MGFYDNTIPQDLLKNRLFPRKRRLLSNYGINNGTNPSATPHLSHHQSIANALSMIQFDGWYIFYLMMSVIIS